MLKKIDTRGFRQIYFCGDIHGRYDLLQQALMQQQFQPTKDLLVLVGDLIDRGNYCCETIAFVQKGLAQGFVCMVAGNHDLYPLGDYILWMVNGGVWFHEIQEQDETLAAQILRQLHTLAKQPLALELTTEFGTIGVVHADVPDNDWASLQQNNLSDKKKQQYNQILTLGRSCLRAFQQQNPNSLQVANINYVVSGHTITKTPVFMANRAFIDTGAFASEQLTVLSLPELMAGFAEKTKPEVAGEF